MSEPHRPGDPEEPTRLFAEYVELRESSRHADFGALLARAGSRADELARRVEIYDRLREISDLLATDVGEGDRPRGEGPAIQRLGRFEELVQIGQGGLSRVFLAYDPALGRRVALKVLLPSQLDTERAHSWIQNEGRVLAHLEHPGVVRVYELGEAEGFAFLAMEHVGGPSLHGVLERMRALAAGGGGEVREPVDEAARALQPIAARCRLLLKIARALESCHATGVVHRDLKPSNVLLAPGPEPKLIDFGLGNLASQAESLTHVTQTLVGTPAYLSPEQVDQSRTLASPKSDQFALGILLYEVLTLASPFHRRTREETLDAVSRAHPLAPRRHNREIPEDLERICLHALARDPSARYPSVAALADDLESFLEHRAISLRRASPWKAASLWAQRHRRDLVLAGLGVGLLLVFGPGLWIAHGVQSRRDFLRDVAEHRPRVDASSSPQDIETAYFVLADYKARAADLDREIVSSLLPYDAGAAVDRSLHACSQAMASALGEAWRGAQVSARDERSARERALAGRWRAALLLDATHCPDCPYNTQDRRRGEIELPPIDAGSTLELWRYEPREGQLVADLVPVGSLAPRTSASYRLRIADASSATIFETDFEVRPERELFSITRRALGDPARRQLFRLEGAALTVYRQEIDVRPFWIARTPVRWIDLPLGLAPDRIADVRRGFESISTTPIADEDPAVIPWVDAAEFAAAVGARLPTAAEWLAAMTAPTFEKPAARSRVRGELVNGCFARAQRLALRYESSSKEGRTAPETFVLFSEETVERIHDDQFVNAFRLAHSDPLPRAP